MIKDVDKKCGYGSYLLLRFSSSALGLGSGLDIEEHMDYITSARKIAH